MRIKSVRIVNFRGFDDQLVELGPYTAMVGPNGAGKSTVLAALNVFFREADFSSTDTVKLCAEDFNNKNTEKPIEITVTFGELDEDAQKDFKDYYRQNELAITAEAKFDPSTSTASVKQYGERNVIYDFARFFDVQKEGGKKAELEIEYDRICKNYPEVKNVKPRTIAGMRDALREYEEKHPEKCKLLRSPDNFYGFSSATDKLSKYVHWVYVPAVRDASDESADKKNSALGRLLLFSVKSQTKFDQELGALQDETLEKYTKIVEEKQDTLKKLSTSLTSRVAAWAHPGATANLVWDSTVATLQIPPPLVRLLAGEHGFEGDITRFGNGFQRSYLIAVLQELAEAFTLGDGQPHAPTLILACEEPELFQHPPQIRHLAAVLQELSENKSQVLVTTHSPYFVFGQHFESVRVAQRLSAQNKSRLSGCSVERIAKRIAEVKGEKEPLPTTAQQAKLQQALQPRLSEMFFANRVVFVEGIEDVSFLTSWLIERGDWALCRTKGLHFVPVDGKSYFIEPVVLAQEHHIPYFVIFDADGNKVSESQRNRHDKDNRAILNLVGGDVKTPFPTSTVLTSTFNQWPTNICAVLKSEIGKQLYDETVGKVMKSFGKPKGSFTKNPMFVAALVREFFTKADRPATSMDKLCEELKKFCAT